MPRKLQTNDLGLKMKVAELSEGDSPRHFTFISYAHESEESALEVARILDELGIRVWIDRERMHSEEHSGVVSERIWNALAEATDVIAVACKVSIQKPWVLHEWQTAATRWLATGYPRIHILILDKGLDLPKLPFYSVLEANDELLPALSELFSEEQKTKESDSIDDWAQKARRLRSQYLMGGSTAVRAIHEFDAAWANFKSMIDRHQTNGWGDNEYPAKFLVWLGQILDLRVPRKWLWEVLESAVQSRVTTYDRSILKNNLGISLLYGGEIDSARSWFHSSSEDCKSEFDHVGEAIAHGNLALLHLEIGQFDEANAQVRFARDALTRATWNGGTRGSIIGAEALLVNHLGRIHLHMGHYEDARRAFTSQVTMGELIESRRLIGVGLGFYALADIYEVTNRLSADLALDRYRDISLGSLNPSGVANAAGWRAILRFSEGDSKECIRLINEEITLRTNREEFFELRRAFAWKALMLRAMNQEVPNELIQELTDSEHPRAAYDASLISRALSDSLGATGIDEATDRFLDSILAAYRQQRAQQDAAGQPATTLRVGD